MFHKPVLICNLLLCLGLILAFTLFWSDQVWFYLPLYNWGLAFMVLWSIAVSIVFTYWVKRKESST